MHFLSRFNKCWKLRVFCVNFLPWNLRSCKFFDKFQVCREAAQVLVKSDCITLHLYNQAFWSQPKPTQCDHNNCMYLTVFHRTVLHDAWYCIVGFGAQTVSRKTPIYLIKSSTTNDGVGATCTNQDDKSNFLTFAHILPRFCQKRLIVLPNNFGFPPDKVLKKTITNPTEPKQINIWDT